MESSRTLSTNVSKYKTQQQQFPPHNVALGGGTTSQSSPASSLALATPTPSLPGKYKEFFLPSAYGAVSDWYYKASNSAQRHVFKQLVKDILEFDEDAAEKGLRPTYQTDIVSASALVTHNGGSLLSDKVRDKCVLFLSYQKKARQQQFRETFGLIQAPKITAPPITRTQTKMDFRPARVATGASIPTEEALFRSEPILAEKKIKKPSDVTTATCEVIGPMGSTSYGTMFPWKVLPAKTRSNIQQKAHDASVRGPPWGVVECVDGHWSTHTREAFAGHEYRFDQPELLKELSNSADPRVDPKKQHKYVSGDGQSIGKRRYQNYNDNYCDALLQLDRKRRKGEVDVPDEKAVEESVKRRKVQAVSFAYNRNSPAVGKQ